MTFIINFTKVLYKLIKRSMQYANFSQPVDFEIIELQIKEIHRMCDYGYNNNNFIL